MRFRRTAMEKESPELNHPVIKYNLAESGVTSMILKDLHLELDDLALVYGHHIGKTELRELIAADSEKLRPEHVLTTVGASSALFMVAMSMLQRGDHIVVAFPNYVTNFDTPRTIGCEVDYFHLRFANQFKIDIEELAARIGPETRLVSLTCPHNPTGTMMTESELRQVIDLVEAKDCYLLYDETYREMSFGPELPIAASLSPRAISVSSLSKTYGLPGIRMGWVICQDKLLMETLLAAKEQIFITNSVVDEEIAYRVLREKANHLEKIRAHIDTNFRVMQEWMSQQDALEWLEPGGGVVCFPRIKADVPVDIDAFYHVLNEKYDTFVGPGHWFEVDRRHMRIGFGYADQNALREGLDNITRAVQEANQTH